MLMHAFKSMARQRWDCIALDDGCERLTYGELLYRIEAVADELRTEYGLGPGLRAAIECRAGIPRIIILMAVSALGCAYVPLDPNQPAARRARIIAASRAHCVLNQDCLPRGVPTGRCDLPRVEDDHEAYVIYTSGSTGSPKGVSVAASGVISLSRNTQVVQLRPSDVVLNGSNFAFDITTYEIWATLLSGGRVAPYPNAAWTDPKRLREAFARLAVTVAFVPSRVFDALVDYDPTVFAGLRVLMVGGEAVDSVRMRRLARSAASPRCLVNAYGPTECTAWATFHGVDAGDEGPVPIGRALSDVRCVVLTPDGECITQMECTGELGLMGPQLATGYVDDLKATASAFVTCLVDGQAQRVYRSRDQVRRRADGQLVYLGRLDDQCKIDGVRVDVHEIADVLRTHGNFLQAVVLALPCDGRARLATALVPSAAQQAGGQDLIAHARDVLRHHLPAAMCPRQFMLVDHLPIDGNGKTDRAAVRALLQHQVDAPASRDTTSLATRILTWLRAHSAIEGISLTHRSELATLALDSVDVLQLLAHLAQQLDIHLSVSDYHESRDVAAFVQRIGKRRAQQHTQATHLCTSAGAAPRPPAWQSLPFLPTHAAKLAEHADSALRAGNELMVGMAVTGPFDAQRWEAAIQAVWERHLGLQLEFSEAGFFRRASHGTATVATRPRVSDNPRRRQAETLASPLLEVFVEPQSVDTTHVYLCFHHVIMDLAAIELVQHELLDHYVHLSCATQAPQWLLPPQYDEFVRSELRRREEPSHARALRKACNQLAGAPRLLPVLAHDSLQPRQADRIIKKIPPELLHSLCRHASRLACTPFILLSAAFAQSLQEHFELPESCFAIIASQRRTARQAAMVGLMRDHRILRLRRSRDVAATCVEIAEQLGDEAVYAHDLERAVARCEQQPRRLFNVLFDYQGRKPTPNQKTWPDVPLCVQRTWARPSPTITRDLSCRICVEDKQAELTLRFRRGALAPDIINGLSERYLARLTSLAC